MRFMIMHRTNAHWESGALPSPDLIARVGQLIGGLAQSGSLLAAEGLRPSSQGVRLQFTNGQRAITDGPFTESKELIAGFAIVRVASREDAVHWATRFAHVLGDDLELDVRPVTEPWDLGLREKPAGLTTQRFMVVQKNRTVDGCRPLSPAQGAAMGRLMEEMGRAGVLLSAEGLEASAKGARILSEGGRPIVLDGPFTESKELLGGFVIVQAQTLQEAVEWAKRYFTEVGAEEVDVRPVAEPPPPPA